jgi:micrococcal nuclease
VLVRPRRRGWWRGWLLLALAGAVALTAGDPGRPTSSPRPAELWADVLDVVDGDTIAVRLSDGSVEHVRYIGVDTPESTPGQPLECFGHEAAALNERLVGGRSVRLEPGVERRDDYGRLLAYVHAGGVFVNARLVARGFARTLTIAPNDGRAPLFARLEARAGRRALGLWKACS